MLLIIQGKFTSMRRALRIGGILVHVSLHLSHHQVGLVQVRDRSGGLRLQIVGHSALMVSVLVAPGLRTEFHEYHFVEQMQFKTEE